MSSSEKRLRSRLWETSGRDALSKGTIRESERTTQKDCSGAQPGKVLQSIDNEEIVVNIDGKRKRMPKAEIHFRQLFTRAIRGDLPTARLISKMAKKHFGPEAEGPSETRVHYRARQGELVRSQIKLMAR